MYDYGTTDFYWLNNNIFNYTKSGCPLIRQKDGGCTKRESDGMTMGVTVFAPVGTHSRASLQEFPRHNLHLYSSFPRTRESTAVKESGK